MSASAAIANAPRFMSILGAIILSGVGLYYTFWAFNNLGLENHNAVATVTGKEFQPPGTSYQSQQIAGRNYVRSLQTAGQYIVTLDLLNQPAAGVIDSALFNTLKPGDQLQVTYQRTRLTGLLIVREAAAIKQGGSL